MSWNWLGWLVWILAFAFLWFVIHYIRVKQLMLIAKTKKRFDGKLFAQYVVLCLIAIIWLGGLISLRYFRPVDYNDTKQVRLTTTYHPLQIQNKGDNYYYVAAKRSDGGKRPIVSYTYWSGDSKYMVSSHFGSIAYGSRLISVDAMVFPWNKKKLATIDKQSAHAYAAVMTAYYKNTPINGLSLRANHVASSYTMLHVPAADMIIGQ
ncbi:LVIS_2131 family protein [Lactobacillaceae bacterium 24-114]